MKIIQFIWTEFQLPFNKFNHYWISHNLLKQKFSYIIVKKNSNKCWVVRNLFIDHPFQECSNLENVLFQNPSNLKTIGIYAFYICKLLKSISIPSSVKYINDYCFYNCSNLENIIFEEESNLIRIGINIFSYCINLRTIKLPSKLKEISSKSFECCIELKSIIILSNISKIQEYAFLNCYNLEYILYYGTNNPEIIYDNSFSGCEKLSFIITYLTYSNETFGQFNVSKSSELPLTCPLKTNQLKSGEIAIIVICGFILIIIICVVLFFTVFRKMKNKIQDKNITKISNYLQWTIG